MHVGPPHSPQCQGHLDTLLYQCHRLGVPITAHKTEGLVFLGIEIDTVAGELRLPTDKLHRLQTLLQQWGDKKVCTRKELESLVGLLNHACKGVRAGRSFLRRMIDLLHLRHHNSAGMPPNPPQHGISSGLGMVEVIRIHLERRIVPTSPSPAPGAPGHLRRLRPVGLWGMVWREMVPSPVGFHHCCTPHHCQGAATHPVGWNSLGSGMAKPPGGVPLR